MKTRDVVITGICIVILHNITFCLLFCSFICFEIFVNKNYAGDSLCNIHQEMQVT